MSSPAARMSQSTQALEQPETRVEDTEALRGLVDAIILTPGQGELRIELKGNMATMLSAATNAKRSPETGDLSLPVEMVAGAGFEPEITGFTHLLMARDLVQPCNAAALKTIRSILRGSSECARINPGL